MVSRSCSTADPRPLTFTLTFALTRDEQQRIADIFLSGKAQFLVFTTYIGHYDRSVSLLEDSRRSSPAFAAVLHHFEVRTTDSVGLTFLLLDLSLSLCLRLSSRVRRGRTGPWNISSCG